MKFSVITATHNQIDYLKKKVMPAWDKQTFKDFEWIIADDNSSDDTKKWAMDQGFKVVSGRGNYDWSIYNRAADMAEGDYLVWVMGDTYPKKDFLEILSDHTAQDRVLNGFRVNVDPDGGNEKIEWRVNKNVELSKLPKGIRCGWTKLTLNGLCVPRTAYRDLGGFYEEYRGYGKADYDLQIRLQLADLKMYLIPRALVYHIRHEMDGGDEPENNEIFERRLREFGVR